MQRVTLSTFLLCVGASAGAQSDARRDPTDAQARVPAVEYRSAFADYQSYRDPEIRGWREANDQVRDLGGHKGLAGKPAAGDPKPSAKPEAAPTEKPSAGGHAGHR